MSGAPPLPEEPLLSEIMAAIAEMPSHGYPRVWAGLRRQAETPGAGYPRTASWLSAHEGVRPSFALTGMP